MSGNSIPDNSEKSKNHMGWKCKEGYVQRRSKCVDFNMPSNSSMDKNGGNTWTCDHGYNKYRNKCKKINLPKNSKLSTDGHSYECLEGFHKNRGKCKSN